MHTHTHTDTVLGNLSGGAHMGVCVWKGKVLTCLGVCVRARAEKQGRKKPHFHAQ